MKNPSMYSFYTSGLCSRLISHGNWRYMMARYQKCSFLWYMCSFSIKIQPLQAFIDRCAECLKEKRYTRVQMEIRSRFWGILSVTGQTLLAAYSVFPPYNHDLMPISFHYIATSCSSASLHMSCPSQMVVSWVWTEKRGQNSHDDLTEKKKK